MVARAPNGLGLIVKTCNRFQNSEARDGGGGDDDYDEARDGDGDDDDDDDDDDANAADLLFRSSPAPARALASAPALLSQQGRREGGLGDGRRGIARFAKTFVDAMGDFAPNISVSFWLKLLFALGCHGFQGGARQSFASARPRARR